MNQAFESFQIKGYRGIENMELTELGQFNIFVGNNNSGKTSILEAISILCDPLNSFQWLNISKRRSRGNGLYLRSDSDLESIKWMFPQKRDFSDEQSYQGEISLAATGNLGKPKMIAKLSEISGATIDDEEISSELDQEYLDDYIRSGVKLEVVFTPSSSQLSLFPETNQMVFEFWEKQKVIISEKRNPFIENATIFPSYNYSTEQISSRRYSKIFLHRENEVVEILKEFDDKILGIKIVPKNKIYIDYQDTGLAPLHVFGDGLKRTLFMALTLLSVENGVLLIDEIETSIHVSALQKIFSWLVKSCQKREIQLFLTTHSLEAIDAIIQSDIEQNELVAFHLNGQKQSPQRIYGNLLHRLRYERGLDVR